MQWRNVVLIVTALESLLLSECYSKWDYENETRFVESIDDDHYTWLYLIHLYWIQTFFETVLLLVLCENCDFMRHWFSCDECSSLFIYLKHEHYQLKVVHILTICLHFVATFETASNDDLAECFLSISFSIWSTI